METVTTPSLRSKISAWFQAVARDRKQVDYRTVPMVCPGVRV